MSHLAKNKIDGIDPKSMDFKLVKDALGIMKKHGVCGLRFGDAIEDFYGKKQTAKGIVVHVAGDRDRGIDIHMDKSEGLVLETDEWGWGKDFNHFKAEFTKAYSTVALATSLSKTGYKAKARLSGFDERNGRKAAIYEFEARKW